MKLGLYIVISIRSTNIIVVKMSDGLDGSFYLVDFDWSGRMGQVQYPDDLNMTTVQRPDGVVDGGLVDARY